MAEQRRAPHRSEDVVALVPARRPNPDGPLARLRAATSRAHEDLDTSLGVLDRPWSTTVHRQWLSLTWGLLAPLERGLTAHGATDPGMLDMATRARAGMALADLRSLGAGHEEVDGLVECPLVPVPRNRAQALGICYVLDGSTLGGKLIADAVVAAGVPVSATTSLTGREGSGRRWRETMAAVDAVETAAVEDMTAAALATFTAYRTWLAPLLAVTR